MPDQLSILIAGLTGILMGWVLSMPVGPVNLTIINGAAQRGFKYAALIGLGAATMDVIYCTIAFTSFSSFFYIRIVKTFMEVFTFAFMLFFGMKFLSAKTVTAPVQLGAAASRLEKRIDEKLHPHSAFMIGFARVLGNMGVLLFWIVAAAYFMSHEAYFTTHDWVENTLAAKGAFVTGVALGANSWFLHLELSRVAPGLWPLQRTDPVAHATRVGPVPAGPRTVRRRTHRLATGPAPDVMVA